MSAIADAAHLRVVQIAARPPVDAPPRGEVTVDLTAHGRFTGIETFFRHVVLSPRLIDVVSLSLSSNAEDAIRMTAVLQLPFWPTQSRLPAPPEGTVERARGVPRTVAEQFMRDQARLLAKVEAVAELRRTRRNPRLFLAELASAVEDRPVVINELSWGDELFVVRGISMGEGPTRALERRLERGYFRLSEFLMARQAGCRRFEARGRCPVVGSEVELPVAQDDPFRQDDAPCRVDRDPASVQVVRASRAKAKTAPGPLTVRSRDMDAADLFMVLSELTGAAFVVSEDVRERLSVDLVGVTLEEALAALAKADIYTSPAAPVRRVATLPFPRPSPTSTAAPAAAAAEVAPRVSLSAKRAAVREVLATFVQADPAAAALAPADTLGRVSVWAREVDLKTLRSAVLEMSSLSETQNAEGARILSRAGGAGGDSKTPIEPQPPLRRLTLRASDLSTTDFELAGIAGMSGTWRAFAYSPSGRLHMYRAPEALTDGAVRSIDAGSVLLEGEDGPMIVRLAPLP